MQHPKYLLIKDYTYDLPEQKIAKYPLSERDSSKILVYKNHSIQQDSYSNIASHLPENSLLVFNNTKVLEARILFQKTTGAVIEIFVLEPHDQYDDIASAMSQKENAWWKCLIGGAGKWKRGMALTKRI